MKTLITLSFIILGLISAQAQTCNNFYVAVSPDGNYLYFSSDRHGGEYAIYRSDLDGVSNLVKLSNTTGPAFYPSVSPDGSKVLFQEGTGAGAEIYMMNNDGTGLVQMTTNSVYDGYPSFSPDGQKIVFDAWDGSQYPEVFTMNADGSGRTQITNEPGANWQSAPKYNPAGDKIYFLQGFNADNHIVMMDTDGSNRVDVTPPNNFGYAEAYLHFSPNGSQIVFFSTENVGYNNGSDLAIANADGSNLNYITNSSGGDYFYQACFHPTNGKLYYTYIPSTGNGSTNIFKMDLNGSNSEALANCSLVGINESHVNTVFQVWPNPSTNSFRVQATAAKEGVVKIYNALGKVVLVRQMNSDETEIGVTAWPTGLYFVELQTEKGLMVQKLVVQH